MNVTTADNMANATTNRLIFAIAWMPFLTAYAQTSASMMYNMIGGVSVMI